jgi:hypothetical protein
VLQKKSEQFEIRGRAKQSLLFSVLLMARPSTVRAESGSFVRPFCPVFFEAGPFCPKEAEK